MEGTPVLLPEDDDTSGKATNLRKKTTAYLLFSEATRKHMYQTFGGPANFRHHFVKKHQCGNVDMVKLGPVTLAAIGKMWSDAHPTVQEFFHHAAQRHNSWVERIQHEKGAGSHDGDIRDVEMNVDGEEEWQEAVEIPESAAAAADMKAQGKAAKGASKGKQAARKPTPEEVRGSCRRGTEETGSADDGRKSGGGGSDGGDSGSGLSEKNALLQKSASTTVATASSSNKKSGPKRRVGSAAGLSVVGGGPASGVTASPAATATAAAAEAKTPAAADGGGSGGGGGGGSSSSILEAIEVGGGRKPVANKANRGEIDGETRPSPPPPPPPKPSPPPASSPSSSSSPSPSPSPAAGAASSASSSSSAAAAGAGAAAAAEAATAANVSGAASAAPKGAKSKDGSSSGPTPKGFSSSSSPGKANRTKSKGGSGGAGAKSGSGGGGSSGATSRAVAAVQSGPPETPAAGKASAKPKSKGAAAAPAGAGIADAKEKSADRSRSSGSGSGSGSGSRNTGKSGKGNRTGSGGSGGGGKRTKVVVPGYAEGDDVSEKSIFGLPRGEKSPIEVLWEVEVQKSGRKAEQKEEWFTASVDLSKAIGADETGRPKFRITYARRGSLPASKSLVVFLSESEVQDDWQEEEPLLWRKKGCEVAGRPDAVSPAQPNAAGGGSVSGESADDEEEWDDGFGMKSSFRRR